jgi:hypothetical protein
MWIASKIGFFSIVQDKNNKSQFMVRARLREHIEAFAKEARIHPDNIIELDDADYRFRIFAPKARILDVVVKLLAEVTYPDFKSAVPAPPGSPYMDFLHSVWALGNAMQPARKWRARK